jgi:hypothetical protein
VYAHAAARRVIRFAAAGFDVSLQQTQAPLSAGACVVVRGSEVSVPLEFLAPSTLAAA